MIDLQIQQFVESYHPSVSHYKLKHSPNRRYLPPELTITAIYKEYCRKYKKISYETFRKVYKKMNIGNSTPSQDECPYCSKYRQHCIDVGEPLPISSYQIDSNPDLAPTDQQNIDDYDDLNETLLVQSDKNDSQIVSNQELSSIEQQFRGDCVNNETSLLQSDNQNASNRELEPIQHQYPDVGVAVNEPSTSHENVPQTVHDKNACDMCAKYEKHRSRYIAARQMYQTDSADTNWSANEYAYTVDMQKIVILPKMTIKNSYFVSRLIVMHETFAALHNNKNKCLIWHEAINGRSAPEVASTYYNVISNADAGIDTFVFWADNCSAQNKNWVLMTTFVILVNEEWGPARIIVKYFEPGHSYMKCDAIHGKIRFNLEQDFGSTKFKGFHGYCTSSR